MTQLLDRVNTNKGEQVDLQKNTVQIKIADFYMDMSKYLLLLGFGFGLFDRSMDGTPMRSAFIVLLPIAAVVSAFLGYGTLRALEPEEEDANREK